MSDPPPVVLVHGVISSRYLLPTVRELARFTRVLVPDLPGVGPNRRRGVPVFADHADAVAEVIGDWAPPQSPSSAIHSERRWWSSSHVATRRWFSGQC